MELLHVLLTYGTSSNQYYSIVLYTAFNFRKHFQHTSRWHINAPPLVSENILTKGFNTGLYLSLAHIRSPCISGAVCLLVLTHTLHPCFCTVWKAGKTRQHLTALHNSSRSAPVFFTSLNEKLSAHQTVNVRYNKDNLGHVLRSVPTAVSIKVPRSFH